MLKKIRNLIIVLVFLLLLVGCGSKKSVTYKVSFMNGEELVEELDVESGRLISKKVTVSEEGKYFVGWYKDKECTEEWNFFKDTVKSNINLYALLKTPVDGFIYNLSPDKLSYVLMKYVGSEEEINILKEYEGLSILKVADQAFKGTNVKKVIFNDDSLVTSIGFYAFSSCKNLEEVVLPKNLSYLGSNAFEECISLEEIDIPDNLQTISFRTFYNCSSLNHISSSENTSLKVIEDKAFEGCSELENFEIPKTIEKIGNSIFEDCSSITSITFKSDEHLKEIGNYIFQGCEKITTITLPQTLTIIPEGTFMDCSSLQTINFGNITLISENAFRNCTKLESFVIKDSLERIDNYAFKGCTKLSNISYQETPKLEIIGNGSFEDCTSLIEFTIPDSLTTLGTYAFSNAKGLKNVIINEDANLDMLGYGAFANCISLETFHISNNIGSNSISNSTFLNCTNLVSFTTTESNPNFSCIDGVLYNKKVDSETGELAPTVLIMFPVAKEFDKEFVIPASVTDISAYAFANTKIQNITLSNKIRRVYEYAFSNCHELTKADISKSRDSQLREGLFFGCENLKSVKINMSVTLISKEVFYGCESLTDISLPDDLEVIGVSAFEGCTSLESVDYYYDKSTSYFSDINSRAFYGCISLSEFPFVDSITKISDESFEGCTSLKKIELGSNLKTIGYRSFYGASNLSEIVLPEVSKIASIGLEAFDGTLWINSLVTGPNYIGTILYRYIGEIEDGMFEVLDGTTVISTGAFQGNESLTNIKLPESLTTINAFAFKECKNLKEIVIPHNTKEIGPFAFSGCSSMEKIEFEVKEESATSKHIAISSIGNNAFEYCTSLKEFYCPNDFFGTNSGFGTALSLEGSNDDELVDVTGSESGYVFYGCTALETVDFSYNTFITNIYAHSFDGCESLKTFKLSTSKTALSFYEYAFNECNSLEEVYIPSSTQFVQTNTFINCPNLQNINFGGTAIPTGWQTGWNATEAKVNLGKSQ